MTISTITSAPRPRRGRLGPATVLLIRDGLPVQGQMRLAVGYLRYHPRTISGITRTVDGALAFVAAGGARIVLTVRRPGDRLAAEVANVGGRVEYLTHPTDAAIRRPRTRERRAA